MSLLRAAALAAALLPMVALPAAASVFYTLTGTAGFPVFALDDEGNQIETFETDDEGNLVLDDDGNPIFTGYELDFLPQPFEVVFAAPDFISVYSLVVPTWSLIGDGSTYFITEIGFDAGPVNVWGGTDTFIDVKYDSNLGIGGGGFLFFQAGALGAQGVYFTEGFPVNTPGFGNFGSARLSVFAERDEVGVIPLPAGLPLLLGGLGLLVLLRRRAA